MVAAAVIERDGRILLTRRLEGAHLAGLWEFPGGKVEPGEDPEHAEVRECREGCGVEVEVIDVVEVAFHRYPKKDVLLLFYDCRLSPGSREVEHLGVADHAWVLASELERYPLPPPDARLVRKLQQRAAAPSSSGRYT